MRSTYEGDTLGLTADVRARELESEDRVAGRLLVGHPLGEAADGELDLVENGPDLWSARIGGRYGQARPGAADENQSGAGRKLSHRHVHSQV